MPQDPGAPPAHEELTQELRETLSHLYDPDYKAPSAVCALTGCDERQGFGGIRSALLRLIQSLEPPPDTPAAAPIQSVYELLHNRYALGLTQEQTAERLNVSIATAWRLQRRAIHYLVKVLLEGEPTDAKPLPAAAVADWQSQVESELAALRASAPRAVASVAEALDAVRELGPALTGGRDVRLHIGHLQPGLTARVHPSLLGQMFTTAVRRMARQVISTEITLFAGLEDGNVRITLTGPIAPTSRLTERDLIADIVIPPNTTLGAQIEGDHAFLWMEMPSPGSVTVLVVDDNLDMADLYQRATAGTKYRIMHIPEGRRLRETIETSQIDVIVLDVMLPDIDGWKLLMRLHEDLSTRSIPIIICSVVRDEELALSLGAALYLPKPVRPHEFIEALDQVSPQAPTAAPRS